jgi:hypothetical protein
MKKIQLVFAFLAILTASVGVYATTASDAATEYFINVVGGTTNCDTTVTGVCTAGDGDQCDSSTQGGSALVFKKVDGGTCLVHKKP